MSRLKGVMGETPVLARHLRELVARVKETLYYCPPVASITMISGPTLSNGQKDALDLTAAPIMTTAAAFAQNTSYALHVMVAPVYVADIDAIATEYPGALYDINLGLNVQICSTAEGSTITTKSITPQYTLSTTASTAPMDVGMHMLSGAGNDKELAGFYISAHPTSSVTNVSRLVPGITCWAEMEDI